MQTIVFTNVFCEYQLIRHSSSSISMPVLWMKCQDRTLVLIQGRRDRNMHDVHFTTAGIPGAVNIAFNIHAVQIQRQLSAFNGHILDTLYRQVDAQIHSRWIWFKLMWNLVMWEHQTSNFNIRRLVFPFSISTFICMWLATVCCTVHTAARKQRGFLCFVPMKENARFLSANKVILYRIFASSLCYDVCQCASLCACFSQVYSRLYTSLFFGHV